MAAAEYEGIFDGEQTIFDAPQAVPTLFDVPTPTEEVSAVPVPNANGGENGGEGLFTNGMLVTNGNGNGNGNGVLVTNGVAPAPVVVTAPVQTASMVPGAGLSWKHIGLGILGGLALGYYLKKRREG